MTTGRGGRDKRMPVRLTVEGWPRWPQRGRLSRLFVHDPVVITNPDVDWESFTRAMYHMNLGGTAKITWPGRQAEADRLLIDHVELDGARIVELGASDGSTSVDLIRLLGDRFASYVITDRFVRIQVSRHGGWTFLWRDGECVVMADRRVVAWPRMSPAFSKLFDGFIASAARQPRTELLMLNPNARVILNSDPRVTWAEHDVFEPLPEPVDVIKIGNLLRRVYFTDDQIRTALTAVHASLVDEGHLLVADHLKQAAAGLYRRTSEGFELVAETTVRSEIGDLITAGR